MQVQNWDKISWQINAIGTPSNIQRCLKRIRTNSGKSGKHLSKQLKKWARLYFSWYLNTEDDFLALKELMFSDGENIRSLYSEECFYHMLTMNQITNYDKGFSWSTLGGREFQDNCNMMFTCNNFDDFNWYGRF